MKKNREFESVIFRAKGLMMCNYKIRDAVITAINQLIGNNKLSKICSEFGITKEDYINSVIDNIQNNGQLEGQMKMF